LLSVLPNLTPLFDRVKTASTDFLDRHINHVDEIRDTATPGESGLDGRANRRHAQHVHVHTLLPDLRRSHSPLKLHQIS